MSLLAALAKGFGAGTINNAQAGFAEQQRQREAAQRKEEMTTELTAAETRLQKNIDAGKADTETRLAAQSSENAKQREHDLAMFQKQLASAAATANANADARYRETNAKNAIGRLSAIAKQKSDIMAMPDDKISPEQRDQAIAMHDMMGYMIASDPNVQQLVSEYGGAGELQYWLSLGPEIGGKGGDERGGGESNPEIKTAPAARPGYTKPGYGGLIGNMQQKAAPGSFWNGREAERALYDKFNGAAPAAAMTHNAQSPAAAEAYKLMYK
ncbi:hypothetical protein [Aeromonas veronii]|uniref:hypothetical protein n=1 Tax=Aeromonas veronii TaxID=654 RepID=UPI0035B78358